MESLTGIEKLDDDWSRVMKEVTTFRKGSMQQLSRDVVISWVVTLERVAEFWEKEALILKEEQDAEPRQSPPESEPSSNSEIDSGYPKATPSSSGLLEKVAEIQKDRHALYGDVSPQAVAHGHLITGILQAHYGIQLDHPVPGYIALAIGVSEKLLRLSTPGYREDDFVDCISYAELSSRLKIREEGTNG